MSRVARVTLILAALSAGIGALYAPPGSVLTVFAAEDAASAGAAVLYYRDPDGKPLYSAAPKTAPDGRAWLAVRVGEDIAVEPKAKPAAAPASGARKKILYYRNPMGLPDVSPQPKKDSMGMDYIPVYEGEDDDAAVKLSPGKVQRTGVVSEPAALRALSVPVRAPGTIQLDERRVSVISLRTEAFVDRVEDVTTGSAVRKGQALFRIYAPAIAQAAADYVVASTGPQRYGVAGARQRLLNFSDSPELLDQIDATHQVPLTFAWHAPRDGIVLSRNISDGMRVMPGDVLFRIADVSVLWALVDVPERDLAAVRIGQTVSVRVRSYPGRVFTGKVALIYPQVTAATRSVTVRIELDNPDLALRPDMYADARIETGDGAPVLCVPESAVIDSGDRQVVIVDRGDGRFEPRPVSVGRRGDGYIEIRDGIAAGDLVVTSANFLIDAESNLETALKGMTGGSAAP